MLPKLRPDVTVEVQGDALEILDTTTGLAVTVPSDPREQERTQVAEGLRALGLADEGLTLDQIRLRQRPARVQAQAEQRVPRLHALLSFAQQRVPYYRERSGAYGAERIRAIADLASLPLMRKSDVRAHFPGDLVAETIDVPSALAAGNLELQATSGSTGERLQVIADLELESVPAQFEELWNLAPSEETPRTAIFTSPTCMGTECHLGRAPFEKRLRQEYTLFLNSTEDLFSLKPSLVEEIASELQRFSPDFLLGNPVYLHWLGLKARTLGVRLPKVKLILSTYQFLSGIQRRRLKELFEAPVYDYYSATDLGGCRIGIECDRGQLHLREDQSLVEILPVGREPLPQGVGAIAVTTLENRVMPVVRYLVGDIGRFTPHECPCAAGDWQTLEVHGRLKDMLQLNGRWVTTREVDQALLDTPGLDFYRCTQIGPSTLSLRAVPAPGAGFDPGEASERLRRRLEVEAVKVEVASRLDPEPSLKFRLTESRTSNPPELP